MKYNSSYLFTSTELHFKKLHHIYPDDLRIYLYQHGFSEQSRNNIQIEMSRLYEQEKEEYYGFQETETSPFDF